MTPFSDNMFKVNLTILYAQAFTIALINDWVEIFVYNFDKATGIIITSFVIRKQTLYNTLVYMKLNNTTTTSFTLKVFLFKVCIWVCMWLKASEFMYVSLIVTTTLVLQMILQRLQNWINISLVTIIDILGSSILTNRRGFGLH